ncbi:MAG: MEDS domain-containing protein [Actinomycetes bacterium]
MPDGAFQPEHRLADLTDEAADAAAEGYACLQVIADMSWALRPQPVAELVLSYEARLTPLCAEWRMAVACLYDLRRLSRHTSHRTYSTHPSTATGSRPRTG